MSINAKGIHIIRVGNVTLYIFKWSLPWLLTIGRKRSYWLLDWGQNRIND